MGTAVVVIVIILVIIGIIALVLMSSYNGFVKSRNLIQESWRQIDVELNRRYELIPNLVETVRGFAAHERNTLEDVTRLRNQAQQLAGNDGGLPSQQRSDIEGQLSGAVRNLMVSVEAYPDLKSNQNFLELQKQLVETEDRIAAGRRYYNANVRVYNTKVDSVPSNIIANMFHFEKATYFEVNDPSVRQAPGVNFGEIAYRGDEQQAGPANQGGGRQALGQQQSASSAGFDQNDHLDQTGGLQDPQHYQQQPTQQQPGQSHQYGSAPQGGQQSQPPQGGYRAPEPRPDNSPGQ